MAGWVELPGPDGGRAAVAGDAGRPGVVVVHDWHGLLPHVGGLVDDLASSGFRAVAPDLYDGRTALDPEGAEALLDALDEPKALRRLEAARGLAAAGGGPAAVVGFSMGGRLALLQAAGGRPGAVVAYYAAIEAPRAASIPGPVMVHLAEVDDWEPPDAPVRFAEALAAAGARVEVQVHAGTRHGFANADVPHHDPVAARGAWRASVAFLAAALREPPG